MGLQSTRRRVDKGRTKVVFEGAVEGTVEGAGKGQVTVEKILWV